MKGKRITKDLIRTYFGRSAKVRGFGGHYRVKTPTGGEVVITPSNIKVIFGGDDVYRACTFLARDKWGCAKVTGSREAMLGAVAHGEAWGVNVRADHSDPRAVSARVFVCLCIVGLGLAMGAGQDDSALLITLFVAVCVWALMKRSAQHAEQRRAEEMGFHYPRVHGTAGAASHDDAEREGWV